MRNKTMFWLVIVLLQSFSPTVTAQCLHPEWCAEIGSRIGERCRTVYWRECAECPGYGCGASENGCDPWCAQIGELIGERCRTQYSGVCGNCAPGSNCTAPQPANEYDAHDACDPVTSYVELLVDGSGSMRDEVQSRARIDWVAEAVGTLLNACPEVEFGLTIFPTVVDVTTDDCRVQVPTEGFGATRRRITQRVANHRPIGATPISLSLDQMSGVFDTAAPQDFRRVILLTDGGETCQGDPIRAVSSLMRQGIQTAVVGFLVQSRDIRAVLDQMAIRGGLPRPDRPQEDDYYFYDVTSGAELIDVLSLHLCERIRHVERCDGADNDCDGATDEAEDIVYETPRVPCLDYCGNPVPFTCEVGSWVCRPPIFEEGGTCVVGVGACRREGVITCGGCNVVAGEPTDEICDAVDNDCDGEIDELSQIECGDSDCGGFVIITDPCAPRCPEIPGDLDCTERCNGEDDNENGIVDDVLGLGECCRYARNGTIIAGTYACVTDDKGLVVLACVASGHTPRVWAGDFDVDWCDGVDNNCDGRVDETVADRLFEGRACYLPGDDVSRRTPSGAPVGATGLRSCWSRCDGQAREVCAAGDTRFLYQPCGTTEPTTHLAQPDYCFEFTPQCPFFAEPMCAPRCDGAFENGCWFAGAAIRALSCEWCGQGYEDEAFSYAIQCDLLGQ